MSSSTTPLSTSAVPSTFLDPSIPLLKPPNQNFLPYPPSKSTDMWRNLAKQAISRTSNKGSSCTSLYLSRPFCFLGFSQNSTLPEIYKLRPIELSSCKKLKFAELGLCRSSELLVKEDSLAGSGWTHMGNLASGNGLSPKGFVSLAEPEAVLSTDVDEEVGLVDEINELLEKMRKEEEQKKAVAMKINGVKGTNGLSKSEKFGGISERKYFALKRRQVKIETETWEQAAKEYRELLMDMCEHKLAPNLPYIKTMFLGWFEPLKSKIDEVQELIRKGKCKASYAPYFDQLPSDKMAVITMHKLVGLLLTGGEHGYARVVQAACIIGDAIEQEAKLHKFLENTKMAKVPKDKRSGEQEEGSSAAVEEQRIQEQRRLGKKVTNLIKKQKLLAVRKIVNSRDDFPPWGADARAKVGGHLINLFVQTAYVQFPTDQIAEGPPDVRPAFVHTFRTVTYENKKGSRRFGVIQCDPMILQGLEKTARHVVIPYMPMLVPPVKWTGYDKGAHFFLPSYLMRTHGSRQQRQALKMVPKKQLEPVFQALDTLGHTRWRVNKRVLSIVERIWVIGGRLGGLVDKEDIPLPEKPITEDETEITNWKWKIRSVRKENSERHSQRCDIELKLAVARKLRDEDGFFYPHNLDFRGRAYPMHPYLNHLGSDLCRGILEFAEGRPLGKSGLRWIKIHLANLYANGIDKLSYEGRVSFTDNHMDDIFDSADEPLQGRQWWLNAEDPFQCLAVCMDLAGALRSPCPEQFISYIPVHQDGSCNGLQHYAALGRDELGAAAVNLVAGEKPADVYSGIAARVLEIMQRDAEKDPALSQDALHARQLINQVDRKLVKQTVMTSVYGVTYIGARDQIKRRLKERNVFTDEAELYRSSCYAAKVTLTALGEMFQAARSIMSWLGDCAKIIASENQPVRWTTPLGLPAVQPYRKIGRHLVKTSLQVLTLQRETEKVMMKRQRTAFPPNFVHSLDGSHMMMTAVACRKAGLNFAGVHDSYWTHACDVDTMNQILREKFVELYELPILEQLVESFQQSFPTLTFPPLPERGEFELTEVLQSAYFFN